MHTQEKSDHKSETQSLERLNLATMNNMNYLDDFTV